MGEMEGEENRDECEHDGGDLDEEPPRTKRKSGVERRNEFKRRPSPADAVR
jgi:hypothetical protein